MGEDGLITREAPVGPKRAMARLLASVHKRGLTVFARVNHETGAAKVGMTLRPTELLMFGNPKGGTPLMQAVQTIGIDLPLRALVWVDDDARTQVSVLDVQAVARRHGLPIVTDPQVAMLASVVEAILAEATGPETEDERLDEALDESFPASDPPELR
jgi:uncharacterized protein (DUF302 family)